MGTMDGMTDGSLVGCQVYVGKDVGLSVGAVGTIEGR